MIIWFIEDDEGLWDAQRKYISREFPKAEVKHFINAGYAAQVSGRPDVVVMDIGAGGGTGSGCIACGRANVSGLAEKFVGVVFILFSAIGWYAEEVANELKEREFAIDSVVEWVDGYLLNDICELIRKY